MKTEPRPLAEGHEPATYHWMPATFPTGHAIVVLPGGGYGMTSNREAENIGEWLNTLGVGAAILRYRHGPDFRHPAPLQDALHAVRQTRAIDGIDQVGILGFSAGGHLAGCACLLGQGEERPDAGVLCYPVVSLLPEYAHGGSRGNLLGPDATDEEAAKLSLERLDASNAPPMFLFHTAQDKPVPPQNSLLLAKNFADAGVPFELHIYERGGHGLSLVYEEGTPDEVASWTGHAREFLKRRGIAR